MRIPAGPDQKTGTGCRTASPDALDVLRLTTRKPFARLSFHESETENSVMDRTALSWLGNRKERRDSCGRSLNATRGLRSCHWTRRSRVTTVQENQERLPKAAA